MGRAFTREDDNETGLANLGERPLSEFRNLVTQDGLALIERTITELRQELASVERDFSRRALLMRDLRYWVARRESAEFSLPEPDSDVVRFGMSVTIERQEGETQIWRSLEKTRQTPQRELFRTCHRWRGPCSASRSAIWYREWQGMGDPEG